MPYHSKPNSSIGYIETIVDNLKYLMYNTILFNEDEFLKYEDKDSSLKGDLLVSFVEDRVDFSDFKKYPLDVLIPNIQDEENLPDLVNNYRRYNEDFPGVKEAIRRNFIENYEEQNEYVRIVCGLPPLDEPYPATNLSGDKFVHELSNVEIIGIRSSSEFKEILMENPDLKYLKNIHPNRPTPYMVRRSSKFSVLYVPQVDVEQLHERYIMQLSQYIAYTLRVVYSEAYKYENDNYSKFLEIFIKTQAAIGVIIDMPEAIMKREFFDDELIRDMFLSHSIEYYPRIPRRYQMNMIRNLNDLIKYKGTDRDLIDICRLFGFDNVELFKYYLLKDHKRDRNGEFIMSTKKSDMMELGFVKVPIEGKVDDYLRDPMSRYSYRQIVTQDPYWDNIRDPDEVVDKILDKEFNILNSKYLSIESMYDITKASFHISYFFNMIYQNKQFMDELMVPTSDIDGTHEDYRLSDILIFLEILSFMRTGIEDTIIDTTENAMDIYGFDFNVDMNVIRNHIGDLNLDKEELGITNLETINSDLRSFEHLMSIYKYNVDFYNHVKQQMIDTSDIDVYRAYKKVFDSMMVVELNNTIFKDINGAQASTFTEYIRARDMRLFNKVKKLDDLSREDMMDQASIIINNICLELDKLLEHDGLDFLFSETSRVYLDLIRSYLALIINFFKSHTVQLLGLKVIYLFNDNLDNYFKVLDKVHLNNWYRYYTLTPNQFNSKVSFKLNKRFKEDMDVRCRVRMSSVFGRHPLYIYYYKNKFIVK